jgi:type I restriction enzyme S subunit
MNLMLLRPRTTVVEPKFLFAVLSSEYGRAHARRRCKPAINQASLGQSDIKALSLLLPPLREQRRIAEILDTAGEAIRQTERLIAKLKLVKAGLLHDLLTRGLDEGGHLRDPGAHPEQFKESEVGQTPRGWEECVIGDLVSYIKSGLSRAIAFDDIGVPVITSTNIVGDRFDASELKYWHEIDPQGANMADYVLDDGDILLNFINSISQIGKACIFRDIGRPAINTTNIFRVKGSNKVTPEFLWRLLQSSHVQHWIQLITKPAINQASFTKPDFMSIPVIVPCIEEQERILVVLDAQDIRIRAEEAALDKLRQVKWGLMDDLLTGRVRV